MNIQEIEQLVSILENSSLTSILIDEKDQKIKLEKYPKTVSTAEQTIGSIVHAVQEEQKESAPKSSATDLITAPMVGTFYESPSPEADSFVKVGQMVSKGDKLCILEAMKIFNEIEADFACKIVEILVKDGQIVEYDTPLFRVEKQ